MIMGLRQAHSDNIIGIAVNFLIFSFSNPYGLLVGIISGGIMYWYLNQAFSKAEKEKVNTK